ncbi:ROK family transcriptional regulator [Streptomyces sp. NPDC051940]|uniref:ROK family transcriptional regulator n=1 Tax=Streptomyces sp. NPDC051940 TaxID=3155675 RepID=UPI00342429ED
MRLPALRLPAVRLHNDAVVLALLRAAGPAGLSRAELAAGTGLTPQAVSKIAARLRAEGLATHAAARASTGGKPATALRLAPEAGHAVGVQLDRDEVTAVVVDLAGVVVDSRRARHSLAAGAERVVGATVEAVRGVLGRVAGVRGGVAAPGEVANAGRAAAPVLGVGVACPGPLDHASGVLGAVTGAPALDGYPLRQVLSDALGLPVALDKDTNAAALGLIDTARPGDGFAYLHLGTGLGAGLSLRGELYRGPRTGAGEFGHQVVQLGGPPCGCGRRGCLEALCLAAVSAGDTTTAARLLGIGAANLTRLLDVDRVFLGGRTVLSTPNPFTSGVRHELGPTVPCEVAPGGDLAVARGAAELVLRPLFAG